jgi:hypothetical protein
MNPFEIRTQMLEMATEYLEKQQEINTAFAKQVFDQLVVSGQKVQADWQEYAPKMYSFEEITEKAKQLYGFVNAK